MKNLLYLKSFLFGAFIIVASSSYGQCLTSWQYYMPISVTNNVSSALSNYQVKLTINTVSLISAGKMTSTGDDIRFLDSGSCQPIPYWIESGINTSSTVIWVKLPSLPGSGHRTIKMYYGNSSAAAASNGDSTFLLFDDFNGSSLNTSKWNTYAGTGSGSGPTSISVGSGQLTVAVTNPTPQSSAMLRSVSSFSSPITIETSVTSVSGSWPCIAILNSNTFSGYSMTYSNTTYSGGAMYLGYALPYEASFSFSPYIVNTSPGTVTGFWQLLWPSSYVQSGSWAGGSLNDSFNDATLSSSVQVAVGCLHHSYGSMSVDWIRARAYASSEPGSSIGSEIDNSNILVSPINGSPFCSASAVSFYVSFTTVGNITFNSNNVFTALLSDSSGNFSNPTTIGTLTSPNAGNISVTIPSATIGLHFRIKVINSTNSLYNSSPSNSLAFAPLAKSGFSINASTQCFKSNSFVFNNSTSGEGPIVYNWNFGDGNSSTTTSPIHSYATPGQYVVKLAATNIAGCTDSAKETVNIYSALSYFTVDKNVACYTGNSFIFKNESSGYNSLAYKWDFGDGNTSNAKSPAAYSYSSAGSYTVKLYVTADSACSDTSTQTIIVNPRVFAGFSASNMSGCVNDQSFVFTNNSSISSGNLSYKWSFGDGDASTGTNPNYTYKTDGTYLVKLTATSNAGCFDTASTSITVYPVPTATIKSVTPATICDGGQAVIEANPGNGDKYQWFKNGSKILISATSTSYDATAAGSYKVVVTSANGCSDTSKALNVTVNPLPAQPVISLSGHKLESNSTAGIYQWYLNGVIIPGADSMNYSPAVSKGTFTVTVTDSNGCSSSSDPYVYDVSSIETQTIEDNSIRIYPNPAHNLINIDLSKSNTYFKTLELIDMNGRQIKTVQIESQKDILKIPVESVPQGIYFIRLIANDGAMVQKIILE